jgi:transposase InsO family protein
MKEQADLYSVKRLSQVLQVSRSGYYAWLNRGLSQRKQTNVSLLAEIKVIHQQSRQTYGVRRVQATLRAKGLGYNRKRIGSLMHKANLKPKMARCFKVTTDSTHDKPMADNQLARQFRVKAPNTHWVSDISYIKTQEGWLYLAVVIDLYSRAVVGWAMHQRMTQDLVSQALKMACKRRHYQAGLLLHSDRGSQYASTEYQALLATLGITCSMSRRGNCWDNAVAESFFHSLKTECTHHVNYQNREQARQSVFDYIEVFYNRQRLHSYLNYQSPWQFENAALATC